jgi:hypothetical protein
MALVDPGGNGFAYVGNTFVKSLSARLDKIQVRSDFFGYVPLNIRSFSLVPRIKVNSELFATTVNNLRTLSVAFSTGQIVRSNIYDYRNVFVENYGYQTHNILTTSKISGPYEIIRQGPIVFEKKVMYAAINNFVGFNSRLDNPNNVISRGLVSVTEKKLVYLNAAEPRSGVSGKQSYQFWS